MCFTVFFNEKCFACMFLNLVYCSNNLNRVMKRGDLSKTHIKYLNIIDDLIIIRTTRVSRAIGLYFNYERYILETLFSRSLDINSIIFSRLQVPK